MSDTSIFLPPHGPLDADGGQCEGEFVFELEYEPSDHYGADADGNRGINVPAYFSRGADAPYVCEDCGHTFTAEERELITAAMDKAASEYTADYEPEYYGPDADDRDGYND